MLTYLFYDLETTGLNPAFDQIVQFAAIRTDQDLNEIENFDIKIKLRPDIIPSPEAMITNRISINEDTSKICEFEAVKKIHKIINSPGTISLGYNTLRFDDEFLRFAFYRNFLNPYTHQYENLCKRMDILPMAVIFFLYKKEVLQWEDTNGKVSLKLENLNSINNFSGGNCHDAAVDVKVTLELARRFFKEKDIWEYLTGFFNKVIDNERIEKIDIDLSIDNIGCRKAVLADIRFGGENMFQSPVLYIGNSIPYKNQTLWLCLDNPKLMETGTDNIEENTFVIRKKLGEPGIILPPYDRYWKTIGTQRIETADENIKNLRANPKILKEISHYYRNYKYPFIPDIDADAALYQMGFLSNKERAMCNEFISLLPDQKIDFIDRFERPELKELGIRLLCRNYDIDNLLPDKFLKVYQQYIDRLKSCLDEKRPVDYRGEKKQTPSQVISDIKNIKDKCDPLSQDAKILQELEDHITEFLLN